MKDLVKLRRHLLYWNADSSRVARMDRGSIHLNDFKCAGLTIILAFIILKLSSISVSHAKVWLKNQKGTSE